MMPQVGDMAKNDGSVIKFQGGDDKAGPYDSTSPKGSERPKSVTTDRRNSGSGGKTMGRRKSYGRNSGDGFVPTSPTTPEMREKNRQNLRAMLERDKKKEASRKGGDDDHDESEQCTNSIGNSFSSGSGSDRMSAFTARASQSQAGSEKSFISRSSRSSRAGTRRGRIAKSYDKLCALATGRSGRRGGRDKGRHGERDDRSRFGQSDSTLPHDARDTPASRRPKKIDVKEFYRSDSALRKDGRRREWPRGEQCPAKAAKGANTCDRSQFVRGDSTLSSTPSLLDDSAMSLFDDTSAYGPSNKFGGTEFCKSESVLSNSSYCGLCSPDEGQGMASPGNSRTTTLVNGHVEVLEPKESTRNLFGSNQCGPTPSLESTHQKEPPRMRPLRHETPLADMEIRPDPPPRHKPRNDARTMIRRTQSSTRVFTDRPKNSPSPPACNKPCNGRASPPRQEFSESCPNLDGTSDVPLRNKGRVRPTGQNTGRPAQCRKQRSRAKIGRDNRPGEPRGNRRPPSFRPAAPPPPISKTLGVAGHADRRQFSVSCSNFDESNAPSWARTKPSKPPPPRPRPNISDGEELRPIAEREDRRQFSASCSNFDDGNVSSQARTKPSKPRPPLRVRPPVSNDGILRLTAGGEDRRQFSVSCPDFDDDKISSRARTKPSKPPPTRGRSTILGDDALWPTVGHTDHRHFSASCSNFDDNNVSSWERTKPFKPPPPPRASPPMSDDQVLRAMEEGANCGQFSASCSNLDYGNISSRARTRPSKPPPTYARSSMSADGALSPSADHRQFSTSCSNFNDNNVSSWARTKPFKPPRPPPRPPMSDDEALRPTGERADCQPFSASCSNFDGGNATSWVRTKPSKPPPPRARPPTSGNEALWPTAGRADHRQFSASSPDIHGADGWNHQEGHPSDSAGTYENSGFGASSQMKDGGHDYRPGDTLLDPSHSLPFASPFQASLLLSELPLYSPLFVKRTNRKWTYAALVGRRTDPDGAESLVVGLDEEGRAKKLLERCKWSSCLRLVNRDAMEASISAGGSAEANFAPAGAAVSARPSVTNGTEDGGGPEARPAKAFHRKSSGENNSNKFSSSFSKVVSNAGTKLFRRKNSAPEVAVSKLVDFFDASATGTSNNGKCTAAPASASGSARSGVTTFHRKNSVSESKGCTVGAPFTSKTMGANGNHGRAAFNRMNSAPKSGGGPSSIAKSTSSSWATNSNTPSSASPSTVAVNLQARHCTRRRDRMRPTSRRVSEPGLSSLGSQGSDGGQLDREGVSVGSTYAPNAAGFNWSAGGSCDSSRDQLLDGNVRGTFFGDSNGRAAAFGSPWMMRLRGVDP